MPRSFGKLCESGSVRVCETIECKTDQDVIEITCATEGMKFADAFLVECFLLFKEGIVCCDVRFRWLRRIEPGFIENLNVKAAEMKIKKKYEQMLKICDDEIKKKFEQMEVLGSSVTFPPFSTKVSFPFSALYSLVVFTIGFCIGCIEISFEQAFDAFFEWVIVAFLRVLP